MKTYPWYKWYKIYKFIFHAKKICNFVTLGSENNKFGVVLGNIKSRYIFERYSFLFGYT